MNSDAEQLNTLIADTVGNGSFRKAVFSKPAKKSADVPARIDVRPVIIRSETNYQFTYRMGNQEIHRNFAADEAIQEMRQSAGAIFRDIRLQTTTEEWIARHSRKGVCTLKRSTKIIEQAEPIIDHDRTRQYIIPDGTLCPFLVATGIMSASGRVRSKHSRKFRQINRFVEFIRDIADRLPAEGTIRVVDFGCGKSYLTFATHYFLTSVLQREVSITGLDRRPDVVATCNSIVDDLKLGGITFEEGDIAAYENDLPVHLAIFTACLRHRHR